MFDFLSPILSSKGGILSAWSFPWGGLCPGGILSGGIMSRGDYVRGGFCPTPPGVSNLSVFLIYIGQTHITLVG